MRGFLRVKALIAVFILFFSPCRPVLSAEDPLKSSVVKVFTTMQSPNFTEPWEMKAQESGTGSGCIIEGNRILTNAHVVSNQIFVEVQRAGDSKKYTATVEQVAHDCDLALLKVADAAFYAGTTPVVLGDLPSQRDKIAVYGFPVGGEELSVTEGVISRIDLLFYAHSMRYLLGIQTDAAINPGNSGGPAFKDGKFIGTVFEVLRSKETQSIGYIVPVNTVKRFLQDAAGGAYHGIPDLGIYAQAMENQAIRDFYKLGPDQTGILICKIVYGSSAWGVLKENDVLLALDGSPISNTGTVPLKENGQDKVSFLYLVGLHQMGENVSASILRDGQPLTLNVPLKEFTRLIPFPRYDIAPTYFVYAGFVFTPFTSNYVTDANSDSLLEEFTNFFVNGLPSQDRKEIVLISKVLSDNVNTGFNNLSNEVVCRVNGVQIAQMKDLPAAFEKPLGDYHVIELGMDGKGKIVTLNAAKCTEASPLILKKYNVPGDRSADLK